MPFTAERTCPDCGTVFTATAVNRIRCDRCRTAHRRRNERRGTTPMTCVQCGKVNDRPYRSGQRYCSRECRQEATREQARVAEPERDEQMARLFRYYKSRESLTIADRPNGTRVLVVSDVQFPFADLPLLDAVDRFVADWKPDDILYDGDIIDAYEISDFDKRPERLFNLEDELMMAKDWAHGHRLRSPKARQWWIDGNHEERLNTTIWRKAQGFSFLVADVAEALELGKWAAGFVPYGKHIDYLGFAVTHGNFVSQHSAYTAKRHLDRYQSSGANGHSHRAGEHSQTDMHGRSKTWYEIGCLCRRDLEYIKGVANWQHAFLIGTVWNGALHTHLVRTIETRQGRGFYAEGQYYEIKKAENKKAA